jgi:hypothetical protein
MLKKIAGLIAFSTALLGQVEVLGQTPPSTRSDPTSFCNNDPRPAVRAYCKDLADLQGAVNNGATKETASGTLNKLDLSHPAATNKFITATADLVAAKAALSEAATTIGNKLKASASGALADAGQARLDRQVSARNSASGTTSLVSKAGSSELLSLALDTGVLTRSVNGATATLSTNADQVFRLITGSDPDCTVTCNGSGWLQNRVLNTTNISASLDLAQQSSTNTPTSGQASGTTPTQVSSAAIPTGVGKLSGITARYELLNNFDPRSTAFRKKWQDAVAAHKVDAAALTLQSATISVLKILRANATSLALDRDKIIRTTQGDTSGHALADFFDSYFSEASQRVLQDPNIGPSISQVMQDRATYRQVWFDALNEAAGTLLTFEYNYDRPASQPLTHEIKLIWGYDFGAMGVLTFNGAVSVYGSVPAGAKYGSLHYGEVSTEYDRTTSGKGKSIQTQLSLAGYWQYQPHPSILNIPAGTVAPGTNIPLPNGTQEFVGTAGSLWVTQAKLTIKASGGINIPIGVSWSNKTDLLQGSKVGAQVGISYNFSSLAGLFTGGGGL